MTTSASARTPNPVDGPLVDWSTKTITTDDPRTRDPLRANKLLASRMPIGTAAHGEVWTVRNDALNRVWVFKASTKGSRKFWDWQGRSST